MSLFSAVSGASVDNDDDDDDDSRQQAQEAFRQFMLHGRASSSSSSSSSSRNNNYDDKTPSPTRSIPKTPPSSSNNSNKKQQRNTAAVSAFCKTMREDWWENDNVLYRVVESLADLRRRIALILRQEQQQQQQQDEAMSADTCWNQTKNDDKCKNYWLTPDDLDLALRHAVRKHETALHNVRSLLAQQAQYQQVAGRRLEEILQDNTNSNSNNAIASACCTRIYQVAAQDLYQKQTWADEDLLDKDKMLQPHSRQAVERCPPASMSV